MKRTRFHRIRKEELDFINLKQLPVSEREDNRTKKGEGHDYPQRQLCNQRYEQNPRFS